MRSPIISDPNPSFDSVVLPDGEMCKLLVVDDTRPWPDPAHPLADAMTMQSWAPMAQTHLIARKLFQRVLRDHNYLPLLTALCIAILGEFYTTTSGAGSDDVRKRLQYRTAPIADFGIAKGSVCVQPCDRLGYMRASNMSWSFRQDPNEHYWLYFTTLRGEEVILDLGMYSFNLCTMVLTAPYNTPSLEWVSVYGAPAYFEGRELRTYAPRLHVERARVSALHNKDLHFVIRRIAHAIDDAEIPHVMAFMEAVSGKLPTAEETNLACSVAMKNCKQLEFVLKHRLWESYPNDPPVGLHLDPEQDREWGDLPWPLPNSKKSKGRKQKNRAP